MKVFLTGVACVGKTTVGAKLADLWKCDFFDLDEEIERFFGTSIERLQSRFLTWYSFTVEAAKALSSLLETSHSRHAVIALPPSGLMGGYWRAVKRSTWKTVVLTDEPEAILRRITFYDIDSNLIPKQLTDKEKRLYLREIKKDVTYFRKSYKRADCRISIAGLDADEAARKVSQTLKAIDRDTGNQKGGSRPSRHG
jgi:shikimate kinase